jgi:uncharacterized RDD family membrane protein YckC
LNEGGAAPGWYADPGGGGQRYFDGQAWTAHVAPWPSAQPAPYGAWPTQPYGAPPWKGARYGCPATGTGALADPGKRFAARLLDYLILIPVWLVLAGIAIAIVAPHAGAMFPKPNPDTNQAGPTPGFVWIYLAVAVAGLVSAVFLVAYETIATVRYGRTLGKRWMKIRPLTLQGRPLGWGRAFGRVAIQQLLGLLSWIGLLDPLWCLWDADRQCLHDKVAGTLVVDD